MLAVVEEATAQHWRAHLATQRTDAGKQCGCQHCERVAIREFCGGMSRDAAVELTVKEIVQGAG